MFFDKTWRLEQSWKRVTKGTFLLKYIEIGPVVSDKKIFKVFLQLPWQPESFMNSKSLKKFQSVSPKDQSCETWLKLAQWFKRRCCLGWLYNPVLALREVWESETPKNCPGTSKNQCQEVWDIQLLKIFSHL